MEKKYYYYRRTTLIFGFGMLPAFFGAMGLIIFVMAGALPFLISFSIAAGFTTTLGWIIFMLKVRIYIDNSGMTYISPFRKMDIQWDNIRSIERKYFYSGSFPVAGPPRDLKIRTKANSKIKVFYFIRPDDAKDINGIYGGIDAFEAELRKYINCSIG